MVYTRTNFKKVSSGWVVVKTYGRTREIGSFERGLRSYPSTLTRNRGRRSGGWGVILEKKRIFDHSIINADTIGPSLG